jgi:hypothetical protein
MGNFADIEHADLRQAIANRAYSKGGIAIDATPADVETTAAVVYSINGVMYSLAIQAAIDVSTLGVLTEKGAVTAMTAQANNTDRIYLLVLNTSAAIKVIQGAAVAAGALCYCPGVPPNHCAFAAVKVANASGSAFTFGTTSLATAGVTDTYFDLTMAPATL